MANKLMYTDDELIEIYNEALDTEDGLNDDIDESPYYSGEELTTDLEDIDFDDYIVEYADGDGELIITLINVFSDDFDGEDVEMISFVEEDEDGYLIYSPFEFAD